MSTLLHPALPPLPVRVRRLAVDARGFPVPFFVQWFHKDGTAFEHYNLPIREGDYPDFRVVDSRKMRIAVYHRRCWVCGDQLGRHLAFVIGPMCAVNRTSGEPPCHRDCAIFAATACPFLSKPKVERREENIPLPDQVTVHPAGLKRNPGVAMVWVTGSYITERTPEGVTFRIGDPVEILYFAEGRKATRAEVMHSIETGMPLLREVAVKDGPEAEKYLEEMYAGAVKLVPHD